MADGVQSGVGVVSTARARAGDWVLYDGRDHWRDARAVRRDLVGDLSLRSKTPVSLENGSASALAGVLPLSLQVRPVSFG